MPVMALLRMGLALDRGWAVWSPGSLTREELYRAPATGGPGTRSAFNCGATLVERFRIASLSPCHAFTA